MGTPGFLLGQLRLGVGTRVVGTVKHFSRTTPLQGAQTALIGVRLPATKNQADDRNTTAVGLICR